MESDDYKQQSKERLFKIASAKIRTTGIAALSAIEENILSDPRFKSIDKELYDVYNDKVRSHILDMVGKQIRNLKSELETYEIYWKRHFIQFEVRERE